MLIIKRKKINSRGMNIVEVMVAMVILMVALMALGFVYPRGRLMTDSSRMSMQATEIARSITEEMKNMPMHSTIMAQNNSLNGLGLLPASGQNSNVCVANFSPANMAAAQWPFHHLSSSDAANWQAKVPVYCWDTTGTNLQALKQTLDGLPTPKTFFLPSDRLELGPNHGGTIEKGILVNSSDGANSRLNNVVPSGNNPELTSLSVTIAWIENRGSTGLFANHITLTSMITENIYKY